MAQTDAEHAQHLLSELDRLQQQILEGQQKLAKDQADYAKLQQELAGFLPKLIGDHGLQVLVVPQGEQEIPWDLLFQDPQSLKPSTRLRNLLSNRGFWHIGQVVQLTRKEFEKKKVAGPATGREMKKLLARKGLSFGMDIPNWEARLAEHKAGTAAS